MLRGGAFWSERFALSPGFMRRLPYVWLLSVAGSAVAVRAQGPTIAASAPMVRACSVQSCALEIRRGLFFAVVARADDSPPSRIGFSGASVTRAVAGILDAEQEAHTGRRQLVRSNVAGIMTVAALLAALSTAYGSFDNDAVLIGLVSVPVGITSGWIATSQRKKSAQAFDRAIWLYNRSLRPTTAPLRTP